MTDSVRDYGFKHVKTFEPKEKIVSMIVFQETIYLATELRVYQIVNNEFVPISFIEPE